MSDRRLTLVLAVSLLTAIPVAAQTTAQLEARVRRLAAKDSVLKDSLDEAKRDRIDRTPRRFLTLAGVTFGFPEEVADAAASALSGADRLWSARYGSRLALLAKDTAWITIAPREDPGDRYVKVSWRLAEQSGDVKVPGDEVSYGHWLVWLPNSILHRWESGQLNPRLKSWLNGDPPSPDGLDSRIVRSDLLFSPSGPARRCLEGDLRDCERALALKDGADPFTEWYDISDLQALVRDHWDQRNPGRAACLATGDVEACRRAWGGNTPFFPPPVRAEVRGSLYLYALEQGGPEALTRIHSAGELPPAQQLSAASGMSVDSLVAGWHASILSQRLGSGPGGTTISLAIGAFWSLVLLALFTWRFRWHHV